MSGPLNLGMHLARPPLQTKAIDLFDNVNTRYSATALAAATASASSPTGSRTASQTRPAGKRDGIADQQARPLRVTSTPNVQKPGTRSTRNAATAAARRPAGDH
jgi:hypothetical protein